MVIPVVLVLVAIILVALARSLSLAWGGVVIMAIGIVLVASTLVVEVACSSSSSALGWCVRHGGVRAGGAVGSSIVQQWLVIKFHAIAARCHKFDQTAKKKKKK